MAKRRSQFGNVRKLLSGRYQVRYTGPGGQPVNAPHTFRTKDDAKAWLKTLRTDMHRGRSLPGSTPMFGAYADAWLETRQLTPRTRAEYRKLLDGHLVPAFGRVPLAAITPVTVRAWHAGLVTGPTRKAHAYGLLRSILNTAVADDVIAANPCRVRGAGTSKRARDPRPASLPELEVIVEAMPEQYRAAVLLAAWCALRFGEIAELRRSDLDLEREVVRVRRAVTHVDGADVIGRPKSEAGIRDVAIPPHLIEPLEQHLAEHVGRGRDALLFPAPTGGQMRSNSQMHKAFHDARAAAGRPDLRFHDLRHTGLTNAAIAGATLAELMERAGHSTSVAALRYQHATADRQRAIAAALSEFHTGKVVTLRPRKDTA